MLVVATAMDELRVDRWLLAPHRLSMTIPLDPQLAAPDVAELLQSGLPHRSLADADFVAAAAELCSDGESGRGLSTCERGLRVSLFGFYLRPVHRRSWPPQPSEKVVCFALYLFEWVSWRCGARVDSLVDKVRCMTGRI